MATSTLGPAAPRISIATWSRLEVGFGIEIVYDTV
jgi:hypothetical protein